MGIEASVLVPYFIGAMAASAAAGTGYSIYAGEQGRKAQQDAMAKQQQAQKQAAAAATSQARKSEMAMNAANRAQPDVSAIMSAATKGAAGGPAGTMLTGPTGVDPNALSLGKNTLLGS
jgi:hypothetical protein